MPVENAYELMLASLHTSPTISLFHKDPPIYLPGANPGKCTGSGSRIIPHAPIRLLHEGRLETLGVKLQGY